MLHVLALPEVEERPILADLEVFESLPPLLGHSL